MRTVGKSELGNADLVIDTVYEGGRQGNAGDDPLPALIGVSNQGGFRYLGNKANPRLIVLTSSLTDRDWPDAIDYQTGTFVYYGDNKRPGRALHETPRYGNLLLRDIFNAIHFQPARRSEVPPILVFANAGSFRDMIFLGLAVPGAPGLSPMEDLVAIWKMADGHRFQNYRAVFTILNCAEVSRPWLEDIRGGLLQTTNAPVQWRRWAETGNYEPLRAETTVAYRTKTQQMPTSVEGNRIIATLHAYFAEDPVAFEKCAVVLTQMMDDNFMSFDLTRPSRDGGRDAIGTYRIGQGESSILVDCALEAKCYGPGNSVGVKEVSRLISRLRFRQFGIMVTTSYLDLQAYREIKEDGHPVVVISAKDIADALSRTGLNSVAGVTAWLKTEFP